MSIAIVNPSDHDWKQALFLMSAGAYGNTKAFVWANGPDSAMEEFVEWIDDNAPGLLHWCDDPEEPDMYFVGHTTLEHGNCIPSWELAMTEITDRTEYNQVKRRSAAMAQNGTGAPKRNPRRGRIRRPPLRKPTARAILQSIRLPGGEKLPSATAQRMVAVVRGFRNADDVDAALEYWNTVMEAHGVEAVRGESVWDNYYGDIVALYVNVGETDAATLVFDVPEEEFYLTDLGEWIERRGQKYEIR